MVTLAQLQEQKKKKSDDEMEPVKEILPSCLQQPAGKLWDIIFSSSCKLICGKNNELRALCILNLENKPSAEDLEFAKRC